MLFPVPDLEPLLTLDLLLELQDPIEESLSCRWATRHIDVHWHDPVTTTHDRVRIMVVATTIGTAPHRHNVTWLRHLVVYLPEGRCHLVSQCACHNHDVGLPGTGSEYHSKAIHVIAGSSHVHHLDSATGQAERHWPQGAPSSPVDQVIQLGDDILSSAAGEGGLLLNDGRAFLLDLNRTVRSVCHRCLMERISRSSRCHNRPQTE